MRISSTASPEQVTPVPAKKSKKILILIIILLLVVVLGICGIFYFGSLNTHSQKNHPLYSSFDDSSDHSKLSAQLLKNKLSILVGKKQDGIFHFAEHFANKLSKKSRAVFIQEYNKDHFEYYQIVKDAKVQINSLLGQAPPTGDWILLSKNGDVIPAEIISNIQKNNPNGKLLIVTTNKIKVKGFKQFTFKPIDKGILQKSATKGLKLASKTADILFEYLSTAEAIYLNLNDQNFNLTQFLGENHHELTSLQKADKLLLQTLCVVGVATSKKEIPSLTQIGILFDGGNIYWATAEKILNYQIKNNVNCKTSVAPQEVIKRQQSAQSKDIDVDDQPQTKPKKSGKKNSDQSAKKSSKTENKAVQPPKEPKPTKIAKNAAPVPPVQTAKPVKGKGKKQA